MPTLSISELTKVRDTFARALSMEDVNQLGRTTGQARALRTSEVLIEGAEVQFSPDGPWLAVARLGNVWLVSTDGGHRVQISGNGVRSRDGATMAGRSTTSRQTES